MTSSLTGVAFDLDGTLVDSYRAITHALNAALGEMGLEERTVEEVRRMVGGGVRQLLVRAGDEAHADEGVARFRTHYDQVALEQTEPLPGSLETVRELHRRGYRLGVATNKPADFARKILDHMGYGAYLTAVLGPEDVERPKPAPDMLLALARRLETDPGDCVYLGDMPLDAETARAAGMRAWLLPTGSSSREEIRDARPDLVLETLEDSLEHLPPRIPLP